MMNLDNLNSLKPVGETTSAINHMHSQNNHGVYGDESLSDDYNNFMAEGDRPTTFRTNSESENEMSSLSTPPESDGDQSSSPYNSDMSDDEEFDLTFLIQKRNILKRYCDVLKASEFYDASIAKNPLPEVPNPIWNEAKEMMKELFEVSDSPIAVTLPPSKPSVRISKRPRIDISHVSRIDSKAYTNAAENADITLGSINEKSDKLPIVCDSNWMVKLLQDLSSAEKHSGVGKALIADVTSTPGGIVTRECGQIKLDPLVGIALCASEANKAMCPSIAMEDALMITDTAQLITQAFPPFLVVHANKSFFTYSDLPPHDVISKPVEEIVKVKDINAVISESKHGKDQGSAFGTVGMKHCLVQVMPVATQSISHLLVQIRDNDPTAFAIAAIRSAKHANVLVGCVG